MYLRNLSGGKPASPACIEHGQPEIRSDWSLIAVPIGPLIPDRANRDRRVYVLRSGIGASPPRCAPVRFAATRQPGERPDRRASEPPERTTGGEGGRGEDDARGRGVRGRRRRRGEGGLVQADGQASKQVSGRRGARR